jgi:nitrate reductase (cytochrome)
MDNFIVVSDAYPGVSAKVADLILPAAMIIEKWGAYGNAERRTQVWRQQVPPPGRRAPTSGMMLEFAKRFKLKDVWGEQKLPGLKRRLQDNLPDVLADALKMGYSPEDTLYEGAVRHPANQEVQVARRGCQGPRQPRRQSAEATAGSPRRRCSQEYRQFGNGNGKDLADFDVYHHDKVRGLKWPVVQRAASG